ncbi:DUF2637 domain-containing protein [Actinomadura sp. 7K507]|uniref:DUF2637 domain-containing protein n=1 Tax=Actinomadura sp. 7K507 TaxID=2530365 RepID=UPI001404FC83|nr:DUF2637 domain-containing protein [Actinomadura sp. 7K507]
MSTIESLSPPPPSFGQTGSDVRQARKLSSNEFTAVAVVAALVAVLGLLGFVNSFAAVAEAARPSFGRLAWTVPLGVDLGIAIFAALDIVLARLNMRMRWLRLIPWTLTAATVYMNVAGESSAFGKVAHAVLPCLWVVAVEVASHVVRVRAGIEAGTRMDRIRFSRWLLSPLRTAALWRRMVLWEVRSYSDALTRERARLLTLTDLQDAYGTVAWRWHAPRRVRALYRLGELTSNKDADRTDGRPAAAPIETDNRPAIEPPSGPSSRTDKRTNARTARRTVPARPRGRSAPSKRAVPDVDDLMQLGWRIAADLESRSVALNRDNLAAALRDSDQAVSNARASALLARLKTEALTEPTRPNAADAPAEHDLIEGDR